MIWQSKSEFSLVGFFSAAGNADIVRKRKMGKFIFSPRDKSAGAEPRRTRREGKEKAENPIAVFAVVANTAPPPA